MIKKQVTYKNFLGAEITEPFYFHMSQAELLRWEAELHDTGGLGAHFTGVMESKNGARIMAFMEDLIERSIGKQSDDGSRFVKTPEIVKDFKQSAAYDAFFMELVLTPDKAAEFMNGIVPKELAGNVEKITKLQEVKNNVLEREKKRQGLQGTGDDPLMVDEGLGEMAQPDLEEVSDPAQGGNVFTPHGDEKIAITESEMREMSSDELTAKLQSGKYKLVYES